MKSSEIKFPRGIKIVHIPFYPDIGSFEQLHRRIEKIKFPKNARRIEASITVSVDLKAGETSYQLAQVSVIK